MPMDNYYDSLAWVLTQLFLMFIWVPCLMFLSLISPFTPELGYGALLIYLPLGVIGIFIVLWMEKKENEAFERKEKAKKEKEERLRRDKEAFERKQKEKGLVKFVCHNRLEKWVQPAQVTKIKEVDVGLSNNFADYTPREFEKFISTLFKKMGYDVELTPTTGDYGVDVVAKKDGNTVAIQVKKYEQGNLIGTQVVQQTLGAMWKVKADQSIIVTTSGFTVYAKEQAKEAPIELWDKKALHEMVRKYMV